MNNIQIFKTNIHSEEDLLEIENLMNRLGVVDWNVDRKDIDKVLRVVGSTHSEIQLIQLITEAGFVCEELE
jgi:hypothetical protein